MAGVFERLDREVALVRGEMDALREKLAAAEDRLTWLEITRETLLSLDSGHELADDAVVEGRSAAFAPLTQSVSATPQAGPEAGREPVRWNWDEALEGITQVLATSGRPMRARELTIAIGEDVSRPARVETTRGRLKHLVKTGVAVELSPGEFAIAAGKEPPLA